MKKEFKTWITNFLFSFLGWSRWTDITTFSYGYDSYLLQGKLNKRTNSKKFKITSITSKDRSISLEKLIESGLIDTQVKFN
jgi:hypothetical protein